MVKCPCCGEPWSGPGDPPAELPIIANILEVPREGDFFKCPACGSKVKTLNLQVRLGSETKTYRLSLPESLA